MIRPLVALIPLALILLCPGAGRATPVRVAVLAPLESLGIPPSEAAQVQRWVEAAGSGVPGHRFLAASRLAKLLGTSPRHQGCAAQPECLGALGRQLDADLVVAGEVGSLSGAYMVYLRLIDAGGRTRRSASGVLDPARGGLRDAARALVHQLLVPERYSGTVKVQVDVPNAWIYLDGKRVAQSPCGPLTGVGVGTHALRVTHEAYRDYLRFVSVGFEQTVEVEATLSAYPVRAEEMRLTTRRGDEPLTDQELPWYRRWWAVTALGAVVLAATSATVAVLARRSPSRDSEVVVRP